MKGFLFLLLALPGLLMAQGKELRLDVAERQKHDAGGLKEGESIALDSPVQIKTSRGNNALKGDQSCE